MRVSLGPAALRGLARILDQLAGEHVRLAGLFADEVTRIRVRLAAYPDAGTPIEDSRYRFVMLRRFPSTVFHRRVGSDEVRIFRMRHARRRPLPP